MIEETEIVHRNESRLHFMRNRLDKYGISQLPYQKVSSRFFLLNWKITEPIRDYLTEVYGLSEKDIIVTWELYKEKMGEIVLEKYPKILSNLKGKSRFNESKMDRYVDYIINEFIENNIVEDEDEFTGEDSLSFKQGSTHLYLREPKLLHFSTDLTLDEFMEGDFGIRVSKIFRERYHINDYNKILLIWKKICGKLLKDYYGNQTINESTNKQERYIEYIKDNLKKSVSFDLTDKNNGEVDVTCIFDFNPEEVFDYEMLLSSDWDKDLYYPGGYLFDIGFIKFLNGLGIYGINDINYFYHWYVKYIRNEFKKLHDGDEYINESIEHNSKLEKLLDVMSDSFINKHYRVKVNQYYEYFRLIFTDGDMDWVIEKSLIKKWLNEYISWSEGYDEILKQDKIVDELPTANAFDQTFVDHLHPLGIKDGDIYQLFYKIVMNKLLEVVIKDTEYYTNKGYKQRKI